MIFEQALRRADSGAARDFLHIPLPRDQEVRALLKGHREDRAIGELLYRGAIRPPR